MSSLCLRQVKNKDFLDMWAYSSSPTVTRLLTWESYSSMDEFWLFFANMKNSNSGVDNVFLAIELEGKVIGSLHIIKRKFGLYQFGYGIIESLWNKGIGTRILFLVEEYILKNTSEREINIYGEIHKSNIAMEKILINGGYKLFDMTYSQNERKRYKKQIIRKNNLNVMDIITEIQNIEEVEAIFEIQTSNEVSAFSDRDLLIVVFEEDSIEDVCDNIINMSYVVMAKQTAAQHIFVAFTGLPILDIYVISSAFYWAIQNHMCVLLDKRGFISKDVVDISIRFEALYIQLGRVISKMNKKRYIAALRTLESIRNEIIIPMLKESNYLSGQNLVDGSWNDEVDGKIKLAFEGTYATPTEHSIKEALDAIAEFFLYLAGDELDDRAEIMRNKLNNLIDNI